MVVKTWFSYKSEKTVCLGEVGSIYNRLIPQLNPYNPSVLFVGLKQTLLTVCLCPTKRTLGLNGLSLGIHQFHKLRTFWRSTIIYGVRFLEDFM